MTDEQKVYGYLGMAARARLAVFGEESAEKAVRSGRARVLIVSGDASENTKKKFRNMCEYHHVPCFEFSDRYSIGHAVGSGSRVTLAVTDPNLAEAVIRVLE